MKILIVDDSSFISLICKKTLEKAGHEVVGTAFDGVEGVKMAMEHRPHVVIMDIALPKKNGLEATKLIIDGSPATKVLAISAIDDDWLKEKAIMSGCYDFLAKPFDTLELLEYIEASQQDGELQYG